MTARPAPWLAARLVAGWLAWFTVTVASASVAALASIVLTTLAVSPLAPVIVYAAVFGLPLWRWLLTLIDQTADLIDQLRGKAPA